MTDLRDLLPHSRKDTKFDAKGTSLLVASHPPVSLLHRALINHYGPRLRTPVSLSLHLPPVFSPSLPLQTSLRRSTKLPT
jgi:hypothetical protein